MATSPYAIPQNSDDSDFLKKLGIMKALTGAPGAAPAPTSTGVPSLAGLKTGQGGSPYATQAAANQAQVQAQAQTPIDIGGVGGLPIVSTLPAGSGAKEAFNRENILSMTRKNDTQQKTGSSQNSSTEDQSKNGTTSLQKSTVAGVIPNSTIDQAEEEYRQRPEAQAAQAGIDALQNQIKALQGMPYATDYRGLMAVLGPQGRAQAEVTPGVESPVQRNALIAQYMNKLQQDRMAQQTAINNYIRNIKGGNDVTSLLNTIANAATQRQGQTQTQGTTTDQSNATTNTQKQGANESVQDPNMAKGGGINAQNRLDNIEYRQLISGIDRNPTLKNQLAGIFSLEQSQGILKGNELNKQSFAEAQNLSRIGAQAANNIRTTGDERTSTYMTDLSKQIDSFLENYVSGGNLKLDPNDPQVKHFINLNQQLYSAVLNNRDKVLDAVSAGHNRILNRGTPESDAMRDDLRQKLAAYGAIGSGGALSPPAAAPAPASGVMTFEQWKKANGR